MKYALASLLLIEADREVNEDNIVSVLEAAGTSYSTSEAQATVAAMEDIDREELEAEQD